MTIIIEITGLQIATVRSDELRMVRRMEIFKRTLFQPFSYRRDCTLALYVLLTLNFSLLVSEPTLFFIPQCSKYLPMRVDLKNTQQQRTHDVGSDHNSSSTERTEQPSFGVKTLEELLKEDQEQINKVSFLL
jgi:hypothetical protein